MEAPAWFVEQLSAIDPNLSVRWSPKFLRWTILRQNPKLLQRPPDVVKVWTDEKGGYLPLDRRVLAWLRESDIHRRFNGRQEKYFAALVEQELDAQQEKFDAAKEKNWNEILAAQTERMTGELRIQERHGVSIETMLRREASVNKG